MVRKHSNYGSVRIDLLNFTADEYYIKSFLELFFNKKDKNWNHVHQLPDKVFVSHE